MYFSILSNRWYLYNVFEHNSLNKAVTILLFSLICISSIGIYPIFKLLQLQAKENVEATLKRGITTDKLKRVEADKANDIVWEDEGKEFRYHGEMYDIVKTDTIKGKVVYYCFNDTKESQLFTELETLVGKQMGNERTHTGAAAKILMRLMAQTYLPVNQCNLHLFHPGNISRYSYHYHFIQGIAYTNIVSPPPEAHCSLLS